MARIDFDAPSYTSAGAPLFGAGDGIAFTMDRLSSHLAGFTAMAGDHAAGRQFAAAYDTAATDLVRAGCALAGALSTMGAMVDAAAYNHAVSDARSHVGGTELPTPPTRRPVTHAPTTPPSSTGGTGEQPSWWQHLIDVVPGLEWPDADTHRLHAAADAWDEAARGFDIYRDSCREASRLLVTTRSPEILMGLSAIDRLDAALATLAGAARSLAGQCRQYADSVESARDKAQTTFYGCLAGMGATLVVGGTIAFLTAGAATPAVAGAEAAEMAAAGTAVAADLAIAAAEAGTAASVATGAGTAAVEVSATAATFEAATIELAEGSVVGQMAANSSAMAGVSGRLAAASSNALFGAVDAAQGGAGIPQYIANPTHPTGQPGSLGDQVLESILMAIPGSGAGRALSESRTLAQWEKQGGKTGEHSLEEIIAEPDVRKKLAEEIVARGQDITKILSETTIDTSKSFTSTTYKTGFKAEHPDLDIGQVHHSLEQQLEPLQLFTQQEIHAYSSLRGIPEGHIGTLVHQGIIRRVYNSLYQAARLEGRNLTRADVIGAMKAIDEYLGDIFVPPHS